MAVPTSIDDLSATVASNGPDGGVDLPSAYDDYIRAVSAFIRQIRDGKEQPALLTSVSGADTITASAPASVAAYSTGARFAFVAAGANTTAVTLNINSIGAKDVTKRGTTALAAGDIASGAVVVVQYDGTRFQVVSPINDVVTTSGTQTVAGDKTFSGKTAITGTATNDSASAGYVGEYVSSTIASGSAVSLTTATVANVTSISLTAGDWDVSGRVAWSFMNNTTAAGASISLTSATQDSANLVYTRLGSAGNLIGIYEVALPTARISVASTTTVYLVAEATFATSTNSAYGRIMARRVR